jgi:hypothetical protein
MPGWDSLLRSWKYGVLLPWDRPRSIGSTAQDKEATRENVASLGADLPSCPSFWESHIVLKELQSGGWLTQGFEE